MGTKPRKHIIRLQVEDSVGIKSEMEVKIESSKGLFPIIVKRENNNLQELEINP